MSNAITVKENGTFDLTSLEAQMALAQKLIDQKIISDTFKTPNQVVVGMQFCIELGVSPMIGLKSMYVVNGKPTLFGDGPLSLIQSSGLIEWIEEFWIDKDGNKICFQNKNISSEPFAAICRLKRKGDDAVQEDYFTVKDIQLAQLKNPTYTKYQRIMMRYRARTLSLKSKFSDVLNGMDVAEYVSPYLPNEGVREVAEAEIMASPATYDLIREKLNVLQRDEIKFCEHMSKVTNRPIEKLESLTEKEAEQAIVQLDQFISRAKEKENE